MAAGLEESLGLVADLVRGVVAAVPLLEGGGVRLGRRRPGQHLLQRDPQHVPVLWCSVGHGGVQAGCGSAEEVVVAGGGEMWESSRRDRPVHGR